LLPGSLPVFIPISSELFQSIEIFFVNVHCTTESRKRGFARVAVLQALCAGGNLSTTDEPDFSSGENTTMTRSVDVIAAAAKHPGMPELIRAIELLGSLQLLAVAIGVGPGKVRSWLTTTYKVPLEYVPRVVKAANDPAVTPQTLRPDYAEGWSLLAAQLAPQPAPRKRMRSAPESAEALEGEAQ
jgi:DNA-binding transcriptional regulator YdaS (Cro superfamily)